MHILKQHSNGGYVMEWWCFRVKELTFIALLQFRMTKEINVDMLTENLLPEFFT